MTQELKKKVYSRDAIEFVTVAVQYCAFLENTDEISVEELTDKLTKILPLLYLKTALLPPFEMQNEEEVEITVSEDDYDYIKLKLKALLGADESYLEVFLQDMKYSDTPIVASISEDLTDIYQDTKNCIAIYEHGITENMNDALCLCFDNFKIYWGQKLVNVLRALHSLKYTVYQTALEEEINDVSKEDDVW